MSDGIKCWKSCPEWQFNDEQIVHVNNPHCPYDYVYPSCKVARLTKAEANAEALNRARREAYRYANQALTIECFTVPSCTIYSAVSQYEADQCAYAYAQAYLAERPCFLSSIASGIISFIGSAIGETDDAYTDELLSFYTDELANNYKDT